MLLVPLARASRLPVRLILMVWVPLERVVVRNTVFWCTVRAEYAFTVATTLPSIDTVLFPELFVVRVMKATLVPVNVVDALPALD